MWSGLFDVVIVVIVLIGLRLTRFFAYVEVPEQMNAAYCKCGAQQLSNYSNFELARVFNGQELSDSLRPPWTVALYRPDKTGFMIFCTGAVLSPRYVLTVSNCFEPFLGKDFKTFNLNQLDLYVGIGFGRLVDRPSVSGKMKRIIPYRPYFWFSSTRYQLAIVELVEPFNFNENTKIWPACLYGTDNYPSNFLFIGYGSTRMDWQGPSDEPNNKPKITRLKRTGKFVHFVIEFLLGFPLDPIEVYSESSLLCYGDLGGGLLIADSKKLFVTGVVYSIGSEKKNDATVIGKCVSGSSFVESVYSNLDWINATAEENLCMGKSKKLNLLRLTILLLVASSVLGISLYVMSLLTAKLDI